MNRRMMVTAFPRKKRRRNSNAQDRARGRHAWTYTFQGHSLPHLEAGLDLLGVPFGPRLAPREGSA